MIRTASALSLIPCVVLGGCNLAKSPDGRASIYRCADGREFSVERNPYEAVVRYANERHTLPRRPSSAGVRYGSTEATLDITGKVAAFASETIVELGRCHEERR